MKGNRVSGRLLTAILLASVSFSGIALADNFYFRVKAPELGVVADLHPQVTGDRSGMVSRPFDAKVMVTKGENQAPFSFAVTAGSLPLGVVLDVRTGEISGTPKSEGNFSATITVTGSSKGKGTTNYSVRVYDALRITGSPSTPIIVGDTYSAILSPIGGDGDYSWRLNGFLPTGLNLLNGVISGVPSAAGNYSGITAVVRDGEGYEAQSNPFSIDVYDPISLSGSPASTGSVGNAYTTLLKANGGDGNYSWSLTGSLPPGLTFSNGSISGIPTTFGSFGGLAITVQDGSGLKKTSTPFSITINAALTISGSPPNQVVIDNPYSASFSAAGGDGHYAWSLDGTLPSGLTFANGKIVGNPAELGSFDGIVVSVQDGTGLKKSSDPFSIKVTEITQTVTSSKANLVLSSLFSSSDWQSAKPKKVIIASGATVYSSSTTAALQTGTGWGGTLTLQIDTGAEVQGVGGAGGSANGTNGGDAIGVQSGTLKVINNGAIRAGGGGGGGGGKGADGQYSLLAREPATGTYLSDQAWAWSGCHFTGGLNYLYWKGTNITTISSPTALQIFTLPDYTYYCGTKAVSWDGTTIREVYRVSTTGQPMASTGGAGGAGGSGRGYNQALTPGAVGAVGSTNAGNGGTGGTGGDWGASGNVGNPGAASNLSSGSAGYSGGLAGFAINGNYTYSGSGIKQGR